MNKSSFKVFSLALALVLALVLSVLPGASVRQAQALSADIVISQVYGGGGNSGAPYRNDFVELFNRGTTTVSLSGMSVQYASATGTGNFGSNPVTLLSGSLAPGQYYLVQQSGGATGASLPTPDAVGTVNMSATGGKVALVNSTTGLACNGGSTPCSAAQLALIKDLVGYGGANFFEGSPAPTLSNSTAALRLSNGCTETDNNAADFTAGAPTPRNTSSPFNPCAVGDVAPTVSSTSPANGAINVALDANVEIIFSEAVNTSGTWFTIACTSSGSHMATVSGGPTSFTLNPDTDFANGESCTVTVLASQVTDQDANDPPDNMAADSIISFTPFDICAEPFTPIYSIQGSGLSASITGNVTTRGVVVGDFEGSASQGGFYIQDLAGDGDAATSDGIFVYTGSSNLVSVGQVVRVTGYARERFNQTTLNGSNSNSSAVPAANVVQCGTGSVPATDVTMPFADAGYPERYEGMYVRLPQSLVISEYFNYDRFGEIVLALPLDGEPRPFTGTVLDEPGAPANARTLANSLRRITLDDANSAQNPAVLRHPNGDPFSLTNRFRGGDTVQNTIGILGFDFSLYRIFPTGAAEYTVVNPRPAAPEPVGGSLRVAAMNTLNYFLTLDPLDDSTSNDNPADNICGPTGTEHDCRGADLSQPSEFTRQRDKLLQALAGLDADIIGLNEMENTIGVEPLADIVVGLPGYNYINTGTIGTDAIKVGLIYRPAKVTPVGAFQILDASDDPRFIDTKSRPALAQTFQDNTTGGRFTVVVNHFKSKGSDCNDVGDPDIGDGQGNCNGTRTLAAQALVDWLATDPTGSGDPDFLIIGDLNSYAVEDPIAAIKAGADDIVGTGDDFTNLISHFQGSYAYSYVFDGQFGYLDHALANVSLLAQITGAADWHINADEPDVLDYDTSFKPASQDALYEPNGYRSSDHDPVIIGLNVNAPPSVDAGGPYSVNEGGSVTVSATGSDPNGDPLTYAWDLDNNGSFETAGQSVTFSAASLDGPSSYTIRVQATDPGGLTAVAQATVNVLNANPAVSASLTSLAVQYSDPIAEVTITGSDVSADIPLSISTEWNVGGGSFTGGLPSWLTLSFDACGTNSCTWALSGTALAAPGTYVVRVTVTDKDGGFSTMDITLTITQEDARATYTGALYVSTESTSSKNANLTLAATVRDISITVDAAGDAHPGDIRNATVTFVNRDTNTPIAGCTGLPVGLVSPGDLQTGTATCNWSVSISGDAQDFTVGIVVNHYYTRNASDDDVVVMVAKPLASEFIAGGGYIILEDSAGQLAGDDGSKANFGLNVKYNKSGKNLKGNVNIIVRRQEVDGIVHVYQIKGNVMSSLAVQVDEGTAVFNGKANIQDITDPLNPISIDGNATLQTTMDDNGEPGSGDTIGITLWNKNGGLWFASKWDGTNTIEQTLAGGNLVVR